MRWRADPVQPIPPHSQPSGPPSQLAHADKSGHTSDEQPRKKSHGCPRFAFSLGLTTDLAPVQVAFPFRVSMLRRASPSSLPSTSIGADGRAALLAVAFVAASACWPLTYAAAETVALTGDAVREAVVGKTVDLDTPLGTKITIHYRDNGLMSGTAGAALAMYLGSSSDRGRWWVENGRLCQKFFKWLEGEASCLRLRQDGRRIAWTRDDGKTGTATIVSNGPVHAQQPFGLGGSALASGLTAAPAHPQTQGTPASRATEGLSQSVDDARPAEPVPHIAHAAHPRPILASLSPASLHVPRPEPIARPSLPPIASHLPQDWIAESDQAASLKAMVTDTRKAHELHRWCHEVRDIRLLLRPQAVDAEAPELLTAARHLQSPDYSEIPAASCLAPLPAMQDVARLLVDAP